MYPDEDSLSEHPMTAVGTVMLAGAILGITDEEALVQFTGYPRPFISAVLFNLRGNRVLNNGSYDCSEWLASDGTIAENALWDHVEAVWGYLWLRQVNFEPLNPCQIYWNNKELS